MIDRCPRLRAGAGNSRGISGSNRIAERRVPRCSTRDVDDGVDALGDEKLARAHAAPTRMAHNVHGNIATKCVEVVGNGGERNVHGAGDVTFDVFVGLANVDDHRSTLEKGGQFTGSYFSDHHGATR